MKDLLILKKQRSIISIDEKNISDYKKIYSYDDYIIYQIDLDFCLKALRKGEDLWIINKNDNLDKIGLEWIKFLTLPIWCHSFLKGYYALPPIKKNMFNCKFVYKAFKVLLAKNNI